MTQARDFVEVRVGDSGRVLVEAAALREADGGAPTATGPTDVASRPLQRLEELLDGVGDTCAALLDKLQAASPKKVTAQFGVEIVARSGQLFAALVDAGGTCTFTVTLEWERDQQPD